jgi:hypothetical protein
LIPDLFHCHRKIANLLRVLRADLDKRLRLPGNLFSRNCADHSGQRFRGGRIDAHDARVCIGRTYEAQIKHSAQLDVVGKFAAAPQKSVLFLAR